jgi:hypothetical protein
MNWSGGIALLNDLLRLIKNRPAWAADAEDANVEWNILRAIYRPTHKFFRIVSASTPLETRPPPCR